MLYTSINGHYLKQVHPTSNGISNSENGWFDIAKSIFRVIFVRGLSSSWIGQGLAHKL